MSLDDDARQLHASLTVVDLHCHPTLPLYLFGRKFHASDNTASTGFDLFGLLSQFATDAKRLEAGNVAGICSAVYVPEHDLLSTCFLMNFAVPAIQNHHQILDRSYFDTANLILDAMDAAVAEANNNGFHVEVATSAANLRSIKAAGKIAVVHALEGGHMLQGEGENPAQSPPNTMEYLNRVDHFHARGCAYMTIGHFFKNDLTGTVEGFAPMIRQTRCFDVPHDPTDGLSSVGRAVVEHMLEKKMIVDMTHTTPATRSQIIALNRSTGLNRPLVFTHVGVNHFCSGEDMGPTDTELRAIADSGGVVGVISMNYWLNGDETEGNGLDNMVATMRYIRDTVGIDHVALGTDFDGFTDPCDDFFDSSMMPVMTRALLADGGFTEDDIRKIMGENVLRVLADGWR